VRLPQRKKQSRKITRSKKRTTAKAPGARLPPGTYERWLKAQTVQHVAAKSEVRVPADSYEIWIEKRVRRQKS
jgi:hypothetical protein